MNLTAQRIVAIASDHAGFELKMQIKAFLESDGLSVLDLGPDTPERCDYPDFARSMALHVSADETRLGILICGSGIGMSMAVNRFEKVRGALVHNGLAAKLARQHNDANVLCLGARLVGVEVAKDAISSFLNTGFEGGRHQERVLKIDSVAVDQ